MSEDTKPETPETPKSLDEQLKEMLRRANVSFFVNPESGGAGSEEGAARPEDSAVRARLQAIRQFDLKPRDIRDYLNRFVVRQDDAKKVLSVAICDHYNHVQRCIQDSGLREKEYSKHNIILVGPTGVGKTYLVRCLARLVGVPFVKADATKFSETGYVGHDVEDLVRDLVKAADGDAELAQYGIIFLDEIDKIASQPMIGRDVSGRGVQVNLLKLMEETDVSLFSQTDLIGQMQAMMEMQRGRQPSKRTISTRHMLFVVSGAFDKLAEQVKKRINLSRIGFTTTELKDRTDSDFLRLMQTRDLIDYGFEPEFVGRLPVRVVCDPLGIDDLEQIILTTEANVLAQYRSDLAAYGIDFQVTREGIRRVAELAHSEQTGARGLMTVLERVFRDYKFELPTAGIKSFEITREAVDNPHEALKELLKSKESARRGFMKQEVESFAAEFEREHSLALEFDEEAIAALVDLAFEANKTVRTMCGERFRDLPYGLKLVSRNTGRTSFSVTKALVENPGRELARQIAESFHKEGGPDIGQGATD